MTTEKLIQIAENEPIVYEAGKSEGYQSGRKAEHDAFWGKYQENGERRNYAHAFAGVGWMGDLFIPKYDVKPVGSASSYMMFSKGYNGDLVELANSLGIIFDFSGVTAWESYTFSQSNLTRIGKVDFSNVSTMQATFQQSPNLHTIEELCVSAFTAYQSPFNACTALKNLIISGTIGKNGFNISPCTQLSYLSIYSIIEHLSDTTSGLVVTLSKAAVDEAFRKGLDEEEAETIPGTESGEWDYLISTKPNWTISLL